MSDTLKITGEFTPDPHICKFILNRTLVEEWTLLFHGPEESHGSPLVEALFKVDGIAKVQVSGSTVTLTKIISRPWPEMTRDVIPAIRGAMEAGSPPISPEAIDAVANQGLDGLRETIEKLFEEKINPAIASHGGFVKLVKIEGHDVYLEMGGGCQGCSASQATLKNGIEGAIREVAPQVREIIDATNHAAGTNPYYS